MAGISTAVKKDGRKKATVKAAAPATATIPTCQLRFPFSLLPGELAAFRGAVIQAAVQLEPELAAAGLATDLFHNHAEDSGDRRLIRQPLVAYQLVEADTAGQGFPSLSGAGAGAAAIALLAAHLPGMLRIYGRRFATTGCTLQQQQVPVEPQPAWTEYALHRWLALNPDNHSRYTATPLLTGRVQLLEQILAKNVQGWYQEAGHPQPAESIRLFITGISSIRQQPGGQLGRNMLLFDATFATNRALPPQLALGNAAARGYGMVQPLATTAARAAALAAVL